MISYLFIVVLLVLIIIVFPLAYNGRQEVKSSDNSVQKDYRNDHSIKKVIQNIHQNNIASNGLDKIDNKNMKQVISQKIVNDNKIKNEQIDILKNNQNDRTISNKKKRSPKEIMDEIILRHKDEGKDDICENTMGYMFFNKWNQTRTNHCLGGDSTFSCLNDLSKMGSPYYSKPQQFQCSGTNIYLQFKYMQELTDCVPHRDPWICTPPKQFHELSPGCFTGNCTPDSFLKGIDNFSFDHLKNFIHGINSQPYVPDKYEIFDFDILALSRENDEFTNPYHAHTDIINSFLVMYLYNLNPLKTHLIFFDEHRGSPFEHIWNNAFSAGKPFTFLSQYSPDTVLKVNSFNIVPAGYINWMHRASNCMCKWELSILEGFRTYVFEWTDIPIYNDNINRHGVTYSIDRPENPLYHWTFISRNSYDKFTLTGRTIARTCGNDMEVLNGLQKAFPKILIRMVDFAQIDIQTQLSVDNKTDLLIGIHGAGMTNIIYTPPNCGLIELSVSGSEWECYNGIATSMNRKYKRLYNFGTHRGQKYYIDVERLANELKSIFPEYKDL